LPNAYAADRKSVEQLKSEQILPTARRVTHRKVTLGVRTLALAAALPLVLAAPALAATAGVANPNAVSLNTAGWVFAADPADAGVGAGWNSGNFRGRSVSVPHVTDPRTAASTYDGSVGWYRAVVRAPRAAASTRWSIRFAQARRAATVWLDGRKIGSSTSSYVPFELSAPRLSDGKPHTLVVRTDNRLLAGRRPDGWWNWGGLTRSVSLVPHGTLAVTGTGTMPQRSCQGTKGNCEWTVLVDSTVSNRGVKTLSPRVSGQLTGPSGERAGGATVTTRPLAPGESARVRFRVPVDGDPKLWTTSEPRLYAVSVSATAKGAAGAPASEKTRIGLRTVRVIDGIVYLNGEPIELRGASIHEDVPGRGPAMTDRDISKIVDELKDVGANVTRAHYALDQRLLSELDEAGIMVWSQAPVYHRDNELDSASGRTEALAAVRSAVLQTRNHPSVITHSVANELSTEPDSRAGTREFLARARALTLDLNPTLPTAVDVLSYPGLEPQKAYAAFDMLGVNTYFGWYKGRDGHSTAELSTLVPFIKEMRRFYKRSALVMTEFGAEATENGPASDKQTYAFQKSYINETLNLAADLPQLSGAIYWTLQEFAVKPNWDGGAQTNAALRNSIHHKGVIARDGTRKPGWHALRDDIASTPLVRSNEEVELATGFRQPLDQRGRIGVVGALLIVAGVLALLVVDLLAFGAWWRRTHADEDELVLAALALPMTPPLAAVAGGDDDGPATRAA